MIESASHPEPNSISIAGVLEEVRAILARRASGHELDLSPRIDAAVPQNIRGESARLRNVLVDLVDLAAPFSRPPGSVCGVALSVTPSPGSRSRLDFAVDTDAGVGATFIARLPFAGVVAETAATDARRSGLILVAEDNAINQQVIVAQLKLFGLAAEVVGNGRVALERWRAGRHALVLTDLQMPEMDGYELAVSIRREERGGRHTPLVALTANALDDEASRCKAAGMDEYLTKPVQLAKLAAVFDRWLGTGRPLAAPPQRPAAALARTGPRRDGLRAPADVAVLAGLIGEDPEILRDFCLDFGRSAAVACTAVKRAVDAGTPAAAASIAHALKASARAIGAVRLGNLCAHVEAAGERGDDAALATAFPLFSAEVAAVRHWIDAHLVAPARPPHEVSP